MSFGRKGLRIIGLILVFQLVLVATHEGEFWPFSIYPMFSQAGKTWNRSLVHQVDPGHVPDWNAVHTLEDLPGDVFAMDRVDVNQNDLANFIQKNKQWNAQQIRGIRSLFDPELQKHGFVVYNVSGRIESGIDTVKVTFTPYIFLNPDTTLFNPKLVDSKGRVQL